MLELHRLLEEYRVGKSECTAVPVFDESLFRVGKYTDGTLVKFRGIIRDVLDPELVLLNDVANANIVSNIDDLDSHQKYVERVPLKVALVPHMTPWARARYYQQKEKLQSVVECSADENQMETGNKGTKRVNGSSPTTEGGCRAEKLDDVSIKKVKTEPVVTTGSEMQTTQLPIEHTISIYIYEKQYGEQFPLDAFKVNEAFEFVCILDLQILGTTIPNDDTKSTLSAFELKSLAISDCFEELQRKQQSSIVLHCCDVVMFDGSVAVTGVSSPSSRQEMLLSMGVGSEKITRTLQSIRESLLQLLTQTLHGDVLAAEYLLLCLLSRVYSRPDPTTTLGQLSINLFAPASMTSTALNQLLNRLTATLKSVMPMVMTIDMSISSLNSTTFAPRKDYASELLCPGVLQVAHGTTVIVNETVLSTGKLNDQGVKNVAALESLVEKMLLPYDFQYYSMDFPQDVAVISVSQGKSILPVHVTVPLEQVSTVDTNEIKRVEESVLESFRLFVAMLRPMNIILDNEQAELAEKHYVECRKAKENVGVEDLHRWLRVARLVALSMGEENVSTTSWETMLRMERQRAQRIAAT